MKYEAMKHQGKAQGNSLQEMSEQVGESMKTIQRLICIASLDEKFGSSSGRGSFFYSAGTAENRI